MGAIPEFERRKLASELTGTPGVDTSGAQIAESVSGVANTGIKVFGNQAIQRQEAKEAADGTRNLVDLDLGLEQDLREHQKNNSQFRGDVRDRVSAFEKVGRQRLTDMINGAQSEAVRNILTQHGERVLGEKLRQEYDTADKQQVAFALEDTTNTISSLARSAAALAGDPNLTPEQRENRYGSFVNKQNALVNVAGTFLAPEKLVAFKADAGKALAKGRVAGVIEAAPQDLSALLKNKEISKHFTPDEIAQFKKEGQSSLAKQKEVTEFNYLSERIEEHQDIWDAYLNNDPTFYEKVENVEDLRFAKGMKELWFKSTPYSPEEKQSAFMDLYGELTSGLKISGKGEKARAGANLQTLIEFQKKVLETRNKGLINNEQTTSLLNRIAVPLAKRTKNPEDWFGLANKVSEPFQQGYDALKKWGQKNPALRDRLDLQEKALLTFSMELEKYENPTPEQISKALVKAKRPIELSIAPSVYNLDGKTPNEVLENGQVTTISGDATATAQRSVGKPPYTLMQRTDNKAYVRKYDTGRVEEQQADGSWKVVREK